MYAKIDLENQGRYRCTTTERSQLPVARMVNGLPHNTDESAIHKCNYKALEVKVQSFCAVKLMKSTLRYIYEVLVWTHTGTSFLISHLGALVAERFATEVL